MMLRRKALALALTIGVAAVAAVAIFSAGPALAEAPPAGPPRFKNLQILPKDITKDQLKAIMKAQAKALGVDCDHCHEMPNADKDTDNKKIAREMMKMVSAVNGEFLKGMKTKATCDTCHRGHEKPESVSK
jgi:hypothetical protein